MSNIEQFDWFAPNFQIGQRQLPEFSKVPSRWANVNVIENTTVVVYIAISIKKTTLATLC